MKWILRGDEHGFPVFEPLDEEWTAKRFAHDVLHRLPPCVIEVTAEQVQVWEKRLAEWRQVQREIDDWPRMVPHVSFEPDPLDASPLVGEVTP